MNVFCTIMAISPQKEARSQDYALLLSNDFKSSLWCIVPYAALHTPGLWTDWGTVDAQPRWQTSGSAGIRTQYLAFRATTGSNKPSGPADPDKVVPSEHDSLSQCWVTVGPPSATLAQHHPSTGSTRRDCWVVLSSKVGVTNAWCN